MKTSFAALLALALVTLTGCNQGTPGGSGVTSPTQKQPAYGEAEKTFKLSVPRMSTTLHQGETKDVAIGIDRGKNFEGDVTISFADGPEGVTIESASPVIKHSETEAKVTLKATADASLGDFTVKVTGHPTEGPDATSEFKLTVAKK
jgi:Quinohemoprotein amine dehydrogenase, alpha subunit domain III